MTDVLASAAGMMDLYADDFFENCIMIRLNCKEIFVLYQQFFERYSRLSGDQFEWLSASVIITPFQGLDEYDFSPIQPKKGVALLRIGNESSYL